ncbi:MAG: hypothetical protein ACJ76H_06410 [Bacteriovoracaceae bacterium]
MKYILILSAIFALNASAASFSPARVVSRELHKKLTRVENAFSGIPFSVIRTHENEAYFLKRIRLQFAPFAEFDVAEIFEVKVTPIIELRWSRRNPKGWSNFKRVSKQ